MRGHNVLFGKFSGCEYKMNEISILTCDDEFYHILYHSGRLCLIDPIDLIIIPYHHLDIDNSRIGIAESTCDYKLAMTGEAESELIDPYPTIDEISAAFRRNYLENACEIDLHLCCVLFILKVLLPIVSTLLFLLTFIYFKTTDYNNKKR